MMNILHDEYILLKLNNNLITSFNILNNRFSSDIENQLFNPIKKGTELKMLTSKQMLVRILAN